MSLNAHLATALAFCGSAPRALLCYLGILVVSWRGIVSVCMLSYIVYIVYNVHPLDSGLYYTGYYVVRYPYGPYLNYLQGWAVFRSTLGAWVWV